MFTITLVVEGHELEAGIPEGLRVVVGRVDAQTVGIDTRQLAGMVLVE